MWCSYVDLGAVHSKSSVLYSSKTQQISKHLVGLLLDSHRYLRPFQIAICAWGDGSQDSCGRPEAKFEKISSDVYKVRED